MAVENSAVMNIGVHVPFGNKVFSRNMHKRGVARSYGNSVLLLFIYFLLYNIVFVLSYINMNTPWVYMCSLSWTPSHLPSHTIPLGHPSAPAASILYHALNLARSQHRSSDPWQRWELIYREDLTWKGESGLEGPLDLLEHLPPNQNLSALLFYDFHQLLWH